ncbi:unnamed protein product [Lactuca saligna]|uniref:Uncharacterized protein n=1 Tax=Lactuca saligna TaxID=75948 RepID=A0AA36A1K0_LACSI|nr:unnamed protein product [Lactuca saligna]
MLHRFRNQTSRVDPEGNEPNNVNEGDAIREHGRIAERILHLFIDLNTLIKPIPQGNSPLQRRRDTGETEMKSMMSHGQVQTFRLNHQVKFGEQVGVLGSTKESGSCKKKNKMGSLMVPSIMLVFCGVFAEGPNDSKLGLKTAIGIIVSRLLVLPVLGI